MSARFLDQHTIDTIVRHVKHMHKLNDIYAFIRNNFDNLNVELHFSLNCITLQCERRTWSDRLDVLSTVAKSI